MNNEFIVILGRKNQGKTYYARHIVKDKDRVIIFDPRRQFSGCGVIVDNGEDFFRYLYANRDGKFRIVYQPAPSFGDENIVKSDFKRICEPVSVMQNIYFVVDEIHLCTSPRECSNEWFINVIDAGRHRGQSLIATTLRYTGVDRDITANADRLILFRMEENADVEYCKKRIGPVAVDLPSLPRMHYIMYETGGEVRKCQPV